MTDQAQHGWVPNKWVHDGPGSFRGMHTDRSGAPLARAARYGPNYQTVSSEISYRAGRWEYRSQNYLSLNGIITDKGTRQNGIEGEEALIHSRAWLRAQLPLRLMD